MTLQVASVAVTVDAIPYGTLQVASVQVDASNEPVAQPSGTLQVSSVAVGASSQPVDVPVGSLQIASIGVGAALDPDAPVANAGADQTLEPWVTAVLTGTGSGPNVIQYSWRQLSGPPVTLDGATTDTATYDTPAAIANKDLVFGFTVTNSLGTDSVESTVTHHVLAATEVAAIGGRLEPMRLLIASFV